MSVMKLEEWKLKGEQRRRDREIFRDALRVSESQVAQLYVFMENQRAMLTEAMGEAIGITRQEILADVQETIGEQVVQLRCDLEILRSLRAEILRDVQKTIDESAGQLRADLEVLRSVRKGEIVELPNPMDRRKA